MAATPSPRLRLSDWSTLRLQVLRVYEGPPRQPHTAWPDAVATTQGWLLQAGHVDVQTRLGRGRATAGQWLFTTSRKLRQDFSDGAAILSLNIRAEWPDGRPLFGCDPPVVLDAARHRPLEGAALALLRLHLNSADAPGLYDPAGTTPATPERYLRYRNAVQRLLSAFVSAMRLAEVAMQLPGGTDPRVLEAMRVIDHMPLHMGLAESSLPERVGLSRSQLHRLFVQDAGLTAQAYLDRRRLTHAQQMLATTDAPIKSVAFALGFRQPSHFTAWFTKHCGASPRRFRRGARGRGG